MSRRRIEGVPALGPPAVAWRPGPRGRSWSVALAALALLPPAARAAPPESRYDAEIERAIAATSSVYPVPKALVKAVIRAESDFDAEARSRAGAVGLMQLMPCTARRVGIGVEERSNPARNVLGGVRLLAVLLRHYRGDVISALVAYNAHPRAAYAPIPRNGETPAYVRAVLKNLRRYGRVPSPPAEVAFRGGRGGSSRQRWRRRSRRRRINRGEGPPGPRGP